MGGFSSAVVPAGYSSIELVAVHGPPPGEHRFLHVGAVASGVSDGAGTAAGPAGVGEGAADGVPAVGVVAGIWHTGPIPASSPGFGRADYRNNAPTRER